jgi:hypothetical protein
MFLKCSRLPDFHRAGVVIVGLAPGIPLKYGYLYICTGSKKLNYKYD